MINIKVAIMGAGLSGLACSIVLEQNGFEPVIYEKRRQVGDRFVNGEIFLSLLHRPIEDALAYLSDEHSIYLSPINHISSLIVFSEQERAVVQGRLGFTNLRGRHKNSFEQQLARQVKSKIYFNSRKTYQDLLSEHTHVVMATGDAAYALAVDNYSQELTVSLKGSTVVGRFDLNTVAAWLDYQLAPQGYAYLIPFSEKEANIVIAYPDYPENQKKDINHLWEGFYQRVCSDLEQDMKITDNFEVSQYIIGHSYYPRLGNTFFTGNCLGSIMPFLGFGQFAAILSGIYAAYDLCGKGSYEELIKSLQDSFNNSLVLRRYLEGLDNSQLDKLVKILSTKSGQRLFSSSKFNLVKISSKLLQLLQVES